MIPIGWVSASPVARTGYGRVTKEIGYRLVDQGANITFIGSFGDVVIWGGVHEQNTPGGNEATIVPLTDQSSAPKIISTAYARKYGFKAIIGFMDCFGLEFLNEVSLPVIGYIPIDGPFTTTMLNYMRNFHMVVAYSEFGYNELLKWYPPSKIDYIPHGIDTQTFSPLLPDELIRARAWLERDYGIPKDAFLGVDVSANMGPRKLLPQLMRTWKRLADVHDDAHLFIFCNAYTPFPKGYDLITHRGNLRLNKNIHFPLENPIIQPWSDADLRLLLGAADVFVHNSVAEGFGLPLVEACACGTPPIAPANSAQTENVKGHGWLVKNIAADTYFDYPVYIPTLQEYPIPDQNWLLRTLKLAYDNPDLVKEYGKLARTFVEEKYAWEVVMPQWVRLLDQLDKDLKLFEVLGKALKG